MVLPSWKSHCESSPGLFDKCRTAPSGRRPSDQAKRLGLCTSPSVLEIDRVKYFVPTPSPQFYPHPHPVPAATVLFSACPRQSAKLYPPISHQAN